MNYDEVRTLQIRETLARSPKVAVLVIGILAVVAVAISVGKVRHSSGPRPVSEGRVYYTVDDGKTWFADSITQPSPFKKDGKVAYRVYVWKVADGTTFVSHLQRSSSGADSGESAAMGGTAAVRESGRPAPPSSSMGGVEVKRPGTGEKGWTRINTVEGEAIATPTAPRGNNAGLEQVEP